MVMPGVFLMLVGMCLLLLLLHWSFLSAFSSSTLCDLHGGFLRQLTLTCRRAVEVTLESTSPHSVTPKEMMAVLNLMSSSPVAMFVKNCSTQQKVMLASVVRCVRREGIAEIPWRNVSPLSSFPSLTFLIPLFLTYSSFSSHAPISESIIARS